MSAPAAGRDSHPGCRSCGREFTRNWGISPTPRTHELAMRAIKAGMAESQDLDWKQALPPEFEMKRWEFAKLEPLSTARSMVVRG